MFNGRLPLGPIHGAAFLTPRVEAVRSRPHVGMSKGLKVQKGIRKFTPDVTYILVLQNLYTSGLSKSGSFRTGCIYGEAT